MPKKIECACGQRILLPDGGTRGKCPRCGRIIDLREPDIPPTRLTAPPVARTRPTGLVPWLTSGVLGLVVLGLGGLSLSLLSGQRDLERRLDALSATAPEADGAGVDDDGGRPAPVDRPAPASGVDRLAVDRLREQLGAVEGRLNELGRDVESVRRTADRRPTPASGGGDLEARVMALADLVTPSIVSIQNGRGTGSGIIVSADGYILTNDHVVQGARNVQVQRSNGVVYPGRVLGKDTYSDVACVKIEGHDLPAITLGDSDALRVGQIVVALGNPFGISKDGSPTVTLGILSALHRVLPIGDSRQYRDAIQTDAAINPGNSGGALVDLDGRLIGINGAITSTTGTNSGIGFAIPVNFVKRILPHLRAGRSTEPGFMGITVGEMATAEIEARGFRGAVVTGVTRNSPAETAGLLRGDIIREFQGEEIESTTRLLNLISYYQVGETVAIDVWRGGRTLSLRLQVGRRPGG